MARALHARSALAGAEITPGDAVPGEYLLAYPKQATGELPPGEGVEV